MNITILTYLEKEGGEITDVSVAPIEEASGRRAAGGRERAVGCGLLER